jgi:hypothetical protein
MKRISLAPATILIIGLMLGVVAVAYGMFFVKMPNDQETAMYVNQLTLLQTEAGKQHAAEQRVKHALAEVEALKEIWKAFVATRTPTNDLRSGGINLAVNTFQLTEDTRKFRNSVQIAVNTQIKKGGVTVINGPLVPLVDPNLPANQVLTSFFNYPPFPFPAVVFDLGTITVQGTYDQIMNNVRSYKSMPHYLAVTDGLRLDGTSPILTGTYNLSIVGFIRDSSVYPDAPEGASGSTGGGMGGMGMGGMGGMGRGGPPGSGMGGMMGGQGGRRGP